MSNRVESHHTTTTRALIKAETVSSRCSEVCYVDHTLLRSIIIMILLLLRRLQGTLKDRTECPGDFHSLEGESLTIPLLTEELLVFASGGGYLDSTLIDPRGKPTSSVYSDIGVWAIPIDAVGRKPHTALEAR